MPTIMWDSYANMGPQPLPVGIYDVAVKAASSAMTANGKHMVKIQMSVQTGPHTGQSVWDQIVFSPENPNSMPFFFGKLAAFGLTVAWLQQNAPMAQDDPTSFDRAFAAIAGALQGRTAVAEVGIKEFNGQPKNEVKTYKQAATAGAPVPGAPVPGFAVPPAPATGTTPKTPF